MVKIKNSLVKGKILISIKSINSEEKCKISILAKSLNRFPTEPTVQFRAKGLLAIKMEEITNENIESKLLLNNPILVILLSSFFALFSFNLIKRVRPSLSGGQSGNQKDIISYLCGVHNLESEIERLMIMQTTTYCFEADRFGFIALNSNDLEYQNKIKNILQQVITYAISMTSDSKAICLYNIAKIEKLQQKETEYTKYLILAKNESKSLIEKRLIIEN